MLNFLILTRRLQLIPLDLSQLELILDNPGALEKLQGIRIMRPVLTERVQGAIRIKIDKMRKADSSHHDWLTYWLVVIRDENVGAGLIGFKGFPDEAGASEIGYGIDNAYQGKGYMSEAVQALVDWAFSHPFSRTITATEVENPASRRLLERLGAKRVAESDRSSTWEIRRR
jgi:GNAT superfamily N-acetyltransferase